MSESNNSPYDWTWLLRVPVAAGQPVPLELWFFWHANTLLPLRELERVNSTP